MIHPVSQAAPTATTLLKGATENTDKPTDKNTRATPAPKSAATPSAAAKKAGVAQDTIDLSPAAKRVMDRAKADYQALLALQKALGHKESKLSAAEQGDGDTVLKNAEALVKTAGGKGATPSAGTTGTEAATVNDYPPLNPDDAVLVENAMGGPNGLKSRTAFVEITLKGLKESGMRRGVVGINTAQIIPWNDASDEMKALIVNDCRSWSDASGNHLRINTSAKDQESAAKLQTLGPQKYVGIGYDSVFGTFFFSYGGPKDQDITA